MNGKMKTKDQWKFDVRIIKGKECILFTNGKKLLEMDKQFLKDLIQYSQNSLQNLEYIQLVVEMENGKINEAREVVQNSELFPDQSPARKTLFRNSVICDFQKFEKKFLVPDFEHVDINYYFHAVRDWSESSGTKRTAEGWIATARNFMRKDKQANKLVLKNGNQRIINREYLDL